MKYLLLLLVLALVALLLGAKRGRASRRESEAPKPPAPAQPQAMLRCVECGMHLPANEALPGKGGVFCSSAHRASFEAREGDA